MRLMATSGPLLSPAVVGCLRSSGLGVDHFENPDDACEAMVMASYDLALLDCSETVDWAAWLKRFGRPATTGFILLSAADEDRRIAALDAGADDCLSHRVSSRELVARVRSILRRPRGIVEQVLQLGNLALDCTRRELAVDGTPLPVPPRELQIMELLMRGPGRIVTRRMLENDLYGACAEVGPNSVEARISCLRRRLAAAGAGATVQNVRGIGYKLAHLPAPGTERSSCHAR